MREANEEDIVKLYTHLNKKYVERHTNISLDNEIKKYTEWYRGLINSPKYLLLIIENENKEFIGQIKYELKVNKTEVMIFVIEEFRDKGIGKKALEKSFEFLVGKNKTIVAKILEENVNSFKLFQNSGFKFYKKDKDFNLYIKELK